MKNLIQKIKNLKTKSRKFLKKKRDNLINTAKFIKGQSGKLSLKNIKKIPSTIGKFFIKRFQILRNNVGSIIARIFQALHINFIKAADFVTPPKEAPSTKHTKYINLSTIQMIIIFVCIILILMPFVTTFNEFITRIVMRIEAYKMIQNYIVPYEVKMVSGVLNAIGIETTASVTRINMMKDAIPIDIFISWNCIGWQSFVLLLITMFVGLKGPYTTSSKIEVVIIGFLGTALINIFRISFIALMAYYFGELTAIIFHDYVSTLMVILWLITFWIFSQQFLLHHVDFVKIPSRKK